MKRVLGFLALFVLLAGLPFFYPRGGAEAPAPENAADTAGTEDLPAKPETESAGEAVLVHSRRKTIEHIIQLLLIQMVAVIFLLNL